MPGGAGNAERVDQKDVLPASTTGAGGDGVILAFDVEDEGGAGIIQEGCVRPFSAAWAASRAAMCAARSTIEQMRLVNTFCWVKAYSDDLAPSR
jgi:hypothetical protein